MNNVQKRLKLINHNLPQGVTGCLPAGFSSRQLMWSHTAFPPFTSSSLRNQLAALISRPVSPQAASTSVLIASHQENAVPTRCSFPPLPHVSLLFLMCYCYWEEAIRATEVKRENTDMTSICFISTEAFLRSGEMRTCTNILNKIKHCRYIISFFLWFFSSKNKNKTQKLIFLCLSV